MHIFISETINSMKKNNFLIFLLISLNLVALKSQTIYRKGNFVSNDGVKTECLIEDKDWGICPSEISYKLTAQEERQKILTSNLQEFEIFGFSKYISKEVQIDKSRSEISELSLIKSPVWQTEELLLKVLVEGKASLYMYNEFNLTRFFYSVNDSSGIQQLVFKNYKATNANGTSYIATNNNFRQQLFVGVNNPSYKYDLAKLNYEEKELKTYFEQYNAQFETTKTSTTKEKVKRDFFKGAIVLGINQRSVVVNDIAHPINSQNFGTFILPAFAAELEFILPHTNDKWSFLIQPVYNYPIYKKLEGFRYYDDKPMSSEFYYQSIDFPYGVRYRYKFNELFSINATGYVLNTYFGWANSTIKIDIKNLYPYERAHRFGFGFGADYKKFSVEIKAFENRDLLTNYTMSWSTVFKGFSVYLKYRLVDLKINR